jgi:hypothetical protein
MLHITQHLDRFSEVAGVVAGEARVHARARSGDIDCTHLRGTGTAAAAFTALISATGD